MLQITIVFVPFRQCFVDDNLLFYTMLFQMFVARVARLDLQSLKDIQMIQRVTKVPVNPLKGPFQPACIAHTIPFLGWVVA